MKCGQEMKVHGLLSIVLPKIMEVDGNSCLRRKVVIKRIIFQCHDCFRSVVFQEATNQFQDRIGPRCMG